MLSEIIRNKYKLSSYTTVKDWKADTKCPLSLETLTSVINRGKEPSIPAYMVMAYLMGITPDEIAATCKAAGDTIYWRLIAPTVLTEEDKEILDSLSRLDAEKKRLVRNLINTLAA